MSATAMNWNTAQIRALKLAFAVHAKEPSLKEKLFGSQPRDSVGMFNQAAALLRKRRADAGATLNAIALEHQAQAPRLVAELQARETNLAATTNSLLLVQPVKDERQTVTDGRTQALMGNADEWIEFEARCISARNQMSAGTTDKGVRDKLMERANSLLAAALDLINELRDGQPKRIYDAVVSCQGEITRLIASAGGSGDNITNTEAFGHAVDAHKATLQGLTNDVAKQSAKPDGVLQRALEAMYGLSVSMEDTGPGLGPPPKIPFQALFDAFALVPSDQSINAMLTNIVYTKLKDGVGGDYSSTDKRMRIDVNVDLRDEDTYLNPETHQPEKVNAFSVTTLHEIGHSVDAAFRIMERNMGDAGCGGWVEVDPAIYTGNAFPDYENALLAAVSNAVYVQTILGTDAVRTAFISYMAGEDKRQEFAKKMAAQIQTEVLKDRTEEALMQDIPMLLKLDEWQEAAQQCLPDQLDLTEYLSVSRPWARDVSGETIGGKAASQQAYKGDAKWWSYATGARTATGVSNYQWRAPGEWFAELYAITWYKKVEPPAGVANAVRAYLFGGHVA